MIRAATGRALRALLLSTSLLSLSPVAAFAEDAPQSNDPQDAKKGHYHDPIPQDIVVTALVPRSQHDVLSGISVLSGEQLTRDLRGTIGETLARQPGVSSTSFGPNASRPILRGLQGERVRILTDGIGSFDVSNTSVDHAVAINPLTAQRVEIVRGPAALLYGSSAIGGVVNVIDSRIPHRVPDEPIHVDGIATYGSAANERSVSGKAEAPLGGGFVAHVDGSWSKTDNMRTGGYILSPALRREAAASSDPDIAALANLKGDLPNSGAKNWEVAGALAYIGTNGNIGVSVNHIDNFYGVPIRYALEPGAESEQVRLHMKQTRADLRAELQPDSAFIDRIRLRAGFADYQHSEIAEDGTVGTTFYNKGLEARAEMIQTKRGGWDGAIGTQILTRDFHVVGDEKFLPANSTVQLGLFTLQSLDLGAARLEVGGRYEHNRVDAAADETLNLASPITRSFDALSFSAGASYALLPGWRIGLNLAHSERAPSAEELFARGPHAGTQAFELGSADFSTEKNWGLEASLHGGGQGYNISLSTYYNWFSGFIYDSRVQDSVCLAATGLSSIDFPCYQYQQADARTYGFEAQGDLTLARWGDTALRVDGSADYVHAQIVGNGPAPLIPPLRLQGGLEAGNDRWTGRAEIEHGFRQNRVAELETTTPAYTLVNASLSVRPFANNKATSITLSANNIFDTVVRRAASVMKDYAPLAGRDIRLTLRFGL